MGLGGSPNHGSLLDFRAQVDAIPERAIYISNTVSHHTQDVLWQAQRALFPAAGFIGNHAQFAAAQFGMLGDGFIDVKTLADAQGVVAQADRHAALVGFCGEPLKEVPPFFTKQHRLAGIAQSIGKPAAITVGIVDLQSHDALTRQLV